MRSCHLREIRTIRLSQDSFKSDDDLVQLYTGLSSYAVMMAVFNHVSRHVKQHYSSIPLFNQFLLVLMKLRLSLTNRDLAH